MNGLWRRYWAVPYHPARALWLSRGVYLLLALDALLLMLEHGGRYAAGGFNVAHFGWLDRLVGVPSPAFYLSLLTGSALLALCGALGALPRSARAALVLTYSLGWAVSQHDSYQHHYLLSWLLAWLVWLPTPRTSECQETDGAMSGAGLPLFATTCATVYLFTAVSKSSSLWQSGAVLRQLAASSSGPFSWLSGLAQLGLGDAVFRWAAHGVLLVQLVIAAAYALVPLRDAAEPRARVDARERKTERSGAASALGRLSAAGWLCSLGFHLLTEFDAGFSIGWFSYYMIWIACVMFAPRAWLARGTELAALCLGPLLRVRPSARVCALGLLCAAAVGAVLMTRADLPGIAIATCSVWSVFVLSALLHWQRGRQHEATIMSLSLAASLTFLLLALGATEIRFDYYRRAAGEMRRMGRLQESLDLYRKAERHAPSGRSRAEVIHSLERQLSEHRGE